MYCQYILVVLLHVDIKIYPKAYNEQKTLAKYGRILNGKESGDGFAGYKK